MALKNNSSRLTIEALEERQVMSTSPMAPVFQPMAAVNYEATAMISNGGGVVIGGGGGGGVVLPPTGGVYDPSTPSERDIDIAMGLPLLESKPGALHTIHLDFTGFKFDGDWNNDGIVDAVRIGPFTTDVQQTPKNINSFSADEIARIREIWARVAEDFAPFNINVTTQYYGPFSDRKAMKIVIGDYEGDWFPEHRTVYGVSMRNSFTRPELPNMAFVFTTNPHRAAQTTSHEAGHTLGLAHVVSTGATAEWSPIMGPGLSLTPRITWSKTQLEGSSKIQDDMAVISRAENAFGYRPDDHGGTTATATSMTEGQTLPVFGLTKYVSSGIIHKTDDADAFKFNANGNPVYIRLDLAEYEPNLIPQIEVWSTSGKLLTVRQSQAKPIAINANLGSGTFFVVVKSRGNYGEVGQFKLSVSMSSGSVLSQSLTHLLELDQMAEMTGSQGSSASQMMTLIQPPGQTASPVRPPAMNGIFEGMTWKLTSRAARQAQALVLLVPHNTSDLNDPFAMQAW